MDCLNLSYCFLFLLTTQTDNGCVFLCWMLSSSYMEMCVLGLFDLHLETQVVCLSEEYFWHTVVLYAQTDTLTWAVILWYIEWVFFFKMDIILEYRWNLDEFLSEILEILYFCVCAELIVWLPAKNLSLWGLKMFTYEITNVDRKVLPFEAGCSWKVQMYSRVGPISVGGCGSAVTAWAVSICFAPSLVCNQI